MIELFLDNQWISWEHNVERRLQQPVRHADNPVLKSEHLWEEEYVTIYGSVLPLDDGGFGMWYMSGAKGMQAQQMLCFARSDDGIQWQRVMSDQHAYEDYKQTNILLGPEPNIHGPCVIRNEHNQNPSERYLLLYDSYPWHRPNTPALQDSRWCYSATSPDGITWSPTMGRPAIPGKSDVGQSVVWDPDNRRYIAYLRGTRMPNPDNPFASPYGEDRTVRYVRASVSEDFEHWSDPVELLRADYNDGDPDHQFHQLSVTRRGKQYIGLLSLFHVDHCVANDTYKSLELGTCDAQLCVSRDGLNFSRVANRNLFLPLGQEGQWDSRWQVTASHIVYHGDQMLFYYGASDKPRSEKQLFSIGVATLPRDRFQSLHPQRLCQPAVIETKPICLAEGDLTINADATRGEIQAELCDFNGVTIEGFSKSQCTPICKDGFDHVIRWDGKRACDAINTEKLYQRGIRIRFYLNQASLYAAKFPLLGHEEKYLTGNMR